MKRWVLSYGMRDVTNYINEGARYPTTKVSHPKRVLNKRVLSHPKKGSKEGFNSSNNDNNL